MLKMKIIRILAIETSADETGAAVAECRPASSQIKLLSNIVYSQIAAHRKTGGIVPEVAARAHIPKVLPAIKLALKKARTNLADITAIAVTAGPGLITSLMVGVDTAKTLAYALNLPLIPINHLEGHLLSALSGQERKTKNTKIKTFPALGLVVSGGHTMLVLIKDIGRYKIIGETLDDAAGEAFDKIAKILDLPYPGGPPLARLAAQGDPKTFDFPRPMLNQKNYDFSFAGLKTAVLYLLLDRKKSGATSDNLKADVAASAQQAIVDVLTEKTRRAAKQYRVKTILIGGGVAANQKLRQTLAKRIKNEMPNTVYCIPSTDLATDNAAMIALAAGYHFMQAHLTTFDKVWADPNMALKSWR